MRRLASALDDYGLSTIGKSVAMAYLRKLPEDDMERRRADILKACAAVDEGGDGVILLTDMFGGTPSNLAISVMEQTKAEVIAGLNLPMLNSKKEA